MVAHHQDSKTERLKQEEPKFEHSRGSLVTTCLKKKKGLEISLLCFIQSPAGGVGWIFTTGNNDIMDQGACGLILAGGGQGWSLTCWAQVPHAYKIDTLDTKVKVGFPHDEEG